jgi:hypothetical protein
MGHSNRIFSLIHDKVDRRREFKIAAISRPAV